MPKFGPGTLVIGEEGSSIDLSCLVNGFTIEPSTSVGDSTTKLCGTVRPGALTVDYAATGNVDLDSDDPEGFFALCAANPGAEAPFEFTPHNGGTKAKGTLVLVPLAFGGEEFGEDMTSDVEFTLVGPPVYVFPDGTESPTFDLEDKVDVRSVINGSRAVAREIGPVAFAPKKADAAAKASSKKPKLVEA